MSLSRTEVILWAMVRTVEPENCCLSVFCIRLSVAVSTEAVASSRTKILLLLSMTLPRQTSCRWPMLQFSPFSVTGGRKPGGGDCHDPDRNQREEGTRSEESKADDGNLRSRALLLFS